MISTITKEQYWQLTGLLALAATHLSKLEDIEASIRSVLCVEPDDEEVSGVGSPGHISDAIFSGYSVQELLGKLGIEHSPPAGIGGDDSEVVPGKKNKTTGGVQ